MSIVHPHSTASIGGHPIHPMLIPFPIVFFVSALITDILYLAGMDPILANVSFWLLLAGLVGAALAALAGLTDFLGDKGIRRISAAWMHMIGNVTAVILELINFLLRLGDHAAIIPSAGIILSAIVTGILLFTGWLGGDLVYRHGVAVDETHEAGAV